MTPGTSQAIDDNREELTAEEARVFLADQTRRYLGMELDEFLRRAEDGTLPDHPMVEHLILLTGARPGTC
jgi:hypothetical protein